MSNDRVTRTTSTSWFSRMGNAVKGLVVGFLLVIVSVVLLFWNEGRAVTTARSLDEGAGIVKTVDASAIDPANDGKLIHLSAQVTPNGDPADEAFGITTPGITLSRKVEMYQWTETSTSETKKNLGGSEETVTTYTYKREWVAKPVDSSSFAEPSGHQNPPMPVESEDFTVDGGTIGAFALSRDQISNFGEAKPLGPLPENEAAIAAALGTSKPVKAAQGAYVVSEDASIPQVGDLKISYSVTKPTTGSLVAAQMGQGVAPYQTASGDALFLTQNGQATAAAMFKDAADANSLITWIIRAVGCLLCFIGFKMVFSILSVVADVVPFIGNIVGGGTSIVAFLLMLVICSLTIGIAWLFYRPLIGGIILAVTVLGIVGLGYLRRKSTPAIQTV